MTDAEFPNNQLPNNSGTNPNLLHPAQPEEFLPPIGAWTIYGGLVLIAAFCAAIGLSAYLKYKVTIKVAFAIRPAGELRIVQSAVEGTVKSIQVEANQAIKKDDIIAIIDDSRQQTKKSQLQGTIQQNQQQLVQLEAQMRSLEGQIAADRDRSNRAIASGEAELSLTERGYQDKQLSATAQVSEAEANLRLAREELQKAIAESNSTLANLRSSEASLKGAIAKRDKYLSNSESGIASSLTEEAANLRSAQNELQRTEAEYNSAIANLLSTEAAYKAAMTRRDRYQPLAESGSLSQDQLEETQLEVERQKQATESQKALVEAQKQAIERQKQTVAAAEARLQQGLEEAELAIQQQQQAVEAQKAAVAAQNQTIEVQKRAVEAAFARWERAKTDLNPSAANVAIAREKIAENKASAQGSLARLNQELQQLLSRKIELQNQVNRDLSELQQLETEIKNVEIRASVTGTIQQLNLRNTSQVVRSGEIIAQIASSEASLVAKALVPSAEIGKLKSGQEVYLRVGACPYTDYGILKGKVSAISPDAIAPNSNSSEDASSVGAAARGGGVYEVTVVPESLKLRASTKECAIQSGMEGMADIISSEETVLQFILRKARLVADV